MSSMCIVFFYMEFSFQVISSIRMFSNRDIQIYVKIRHITFISTDFHKAFFVISLVFNISNIALEMDSIFIVDMNSCLSNQDQCFSCLG